MQTQLQHYKNIDKSTQLIFNEKDTFKVFHIKNLSNEPAHFKHTLNKSYIQLYFSEGKNCYVAFNMEHCAVKFENLNSAMVYFKDETMKILFKTAPNETITGVLISLEYFHSLFSVHDDLFFNFKNFSIGKPIIEQKNVGQTIKAILIQLTNKNINESLYPIFMKGKILELLSYYFSKNIESEEENCPFIANEETIGKIKSAKELIIKEMSNPPSLEEIAKKVGLNIKKLKTSFKDFYGAPVFTYLLNYKMELAKKLLLEQKLNVNEIALHLGYSTSSHFIAAFKRKFGTTPKQFAKL